MRAVVRSAYGGPEVLRVEEIPTPAVGDDQVLVEVLAAAVNPLEWHMMTGTPSLVRLQEGLRRPKAAGLGMDLAGRVVAVGKDVASLRPGDEVFGDGRSAYAQYAVAAERNLVHKPAGITFEQAAGVPVAAITALQALRDTARLEPGQTVLINGASGGVGTFAVQIAKALGATVTAVCSTRNMDVVRSLGANRVIDYTAEDFTRGGERYDVVFDAVGLRRLAHLRRIIAPGGVYVAVSVPKSVPKIIVRMLAMVTWSLVSSRKMRPMLAKTTAADLAILRDMLEAGDVVPVVDRTYPLTEAAAALGYQGEGHTQGKTLIVP
jgi:NADPH:quinone reductase-like Zn-dependent oxidoreductase